MEGLFEVMPGLGWREGLGLVIFGYIIFEQLSFFSKRKHLPGPSFVLPFVGSVIAMVVNPTGFWVDQAKDASKVGVSWNALLGKFVLFVRDSQLSQKIFANVRPDAFHLVGHPLGKKLFGDHNLIFMFGEEHKDLRRRLAPLFTLKALGVYVSIQEKTQKEHITKWLDRADKLKNNPIRIRLLCRDMNLETSQNVFVGPYLTPDMRERFNEDYKNFNVGLMSLPIYFPGFSFYKATKSVKNIQNSLARCAAASKARMATGAEPSCLMDFWMVETVRELGEAEAAGMPPPSHSSDFEIGCHIFDFLFAAQDASTSSLVWAITLTESHPHVLEKLREEQSLLRPNPLAPYTPESLRELKYTEMVVKEVLRYRPPATMVPHIASTDFALTDTYTIPKGTIVFPSLLESSFQGFTDPEVFDPERFSPERMEDQVYRKNWLLFGAGPHQCIGQRYAINQLILFTSLFTTFVDYKRARTPGCDDLLYTPTITPKDEGLVYISPRIVSEH